MTKRKLLMVFEVSDCPTTCLHCWADAKSYDHVPAAKVEVLLKAVNDYCNKKGWNFMPIYVNEISNHNKFIILVKAQMKYSIPSLDELPSPFVTTGVPLANRGDKEQILDNFKDLGLKRFWFTLHGIEGTHDKFTGRKGSFNETMKAIDVAYNNGFKVGTNIFITTESIKEIDDIVNLVKKTPFYKTSWEVAIYHDIKRLNVYEKYRPGLGSLLPYSNKISALCSFNQDKWNHLDEFTESAFIKKALKDEGDWSKYEYPNEDTNIYLYCDNKSKISLGMNGRGESFGILTEESVEEVFNNIEKFVDENKSVYPYYPVKTPIIKVLPSIKTLAQNYGKKSNKIYFEESSLLHLWINSWLKDYEE